MAEHYSPDCNCGSCADYRSRRSIRPAIVLNNRRLPISDIINPDLLEILLSDTFFWKGTKLPNGKIVLVKILLRDRNANLKRFAHLIAKAQAQNTCPDGQGNPVDQTLE